MRLAALYSGVILFSVGGITLLFLWCEHVPGTQKSLSQRSLPQLTTVLAQGLRYREYTNPTYDLIRFSSCRIEKMRQGFIALGGFNRLVFDDLEIVLPDIDQVSGLTNGVCMPELGFSDAFLKTQARGLRFSGVKINRLMLYKRNASTRVPYLKAENAASSSIGLNLKNVLLYTNQQQVAYKSAYFVYNRSTKSFQFKPKDIEEHMRSNSL